jgi:Tfp pilus assembly protein PilN
LACGAVAVLALGTTGSLFLAAESKRAEARGLQAQFEKLAPVRDEIAKNEAALSLLAPKLTTLTKAREATDRWSEIFKHVSLTLPSGAFLTNVRSDRQSDPSKPVVCEFTGMSLDQNLVGDFMLALQNCPQLEAVSLKYTEEHRAQQGTGLEFTIATQVVGTEEVAAKGSEEKKS